MCLARHGKAWHDGQFYHHHHHPGCVVPATYHLPATSRDPSILSLSQHSPPKLLRACLHSMKKCRHAPKGRLAVVTGVHGTFPCYIYGQEDKYLYLPWRRKNQKFWYYHPGDISPFWCWLGWLCCTFFISERRKEREEPSSVWGPQNFLGKTQTELKAGSQGQIIPHTHHRTLHFFAFCALPCPSFSSPHLSCTLREEAWHCTARVHGFF